MKIVTYNVNGLRQRVSQFGSIAKLLESLDADIICFQETKLSKQELSSDLSLVDGYESFFSCTRTIQKGRVGYSGVATFCRVKSAFSSNEVSLPLHAEEGFTGIIENLNSRKSEFFFKVEDCFGEFEKELLFDIDGEGRCIMTDHGHFVIFNIYGPRADSEDPERSQFKINFFKMLQRFSSESKRVILSNPDSGIRSGAQPLKWFSEKRLEFLISLGRVIIVVGDLNIAPFSIDSCRARPYFEGNMCRRWFRSMLMKSGGHFFDVFRSKHPERSEAYTCWPQNTGAEEFNFGTRIDHILATTPCLHQGVNSLCHDFVTCHVKKCDILLQFKRWKPGDASRWKGRRIKKLEGSDHAPVYMILNDIPDISCHSTPSLSSRYNPKLHGFQQSIVSLFEKKYMENGKNMTSFCESPCENSVVISSCQNKRKAHFSSELCVISDSQSEGDNSNPCNLPPCSTSDYDVSEITSSMPCRGITVPGSLTSKRKRQCQQSQMSLKYFFKNKSVINGSTEEKCIQLFDNQCNNLQSEPCSGIASQVELSVSDEKNENALVEWRRIQDVMKKSVPLCKGHREPCVPRVVKKTGSNFGRRFFVCARAEGPLSNIEANCGYFKWASSSTNSK